MIHFVTFRTVFFSVFLGLMNGFFFPFMSRSRVHHHLECQNMEYGDSNTIFLSRRPTHPRAA